MKTDLKLIHAEIYYEFTKPEVWTWNDVSNWALEMGKKYMGTGYYWTFGNVATDEKEGEVFVTLKCNDIDMMSKTESFARKTVESSIERWTKHIIKRGEQTGIVDVSKWRGCECSQCRMYSYHSTDCKFEGLVVEGQ